MAFFQYTSPDDTRSIAAPSRSSLQTPPSSADPEQPDCKWISTIADDQLLSSNTPPWPAVGAYGSGLSAMQRGHPMQIPLAADSFPDHAGSPTYGWTSELASNLHNPLTSPNAFHPSSLGPPFQPLPSAPYGFEPPYQWGYVSGPSQVPGAGHAISPSVSPQSISHRHSAASSPHTHSDGYVVTSLSTSGQAFHVRRTSFSQIAQPTPRPLQQSPLIDPVNLLMQRPHDQSLTINAPSPALSSASIAIKTEQGNESSSPMPSRFRPAFRKSLSTTNIQQSRMKRSYTKPKDANCECGHCGKLFQRSYNLKIHLDTHERHRVQPYACPYHGCGRRFGRRTDLGRHESSVSRCVMGLFHGEHSSANAS